jgi:hypothetical protein
MTKGVGMGTCENKAAFRFTWAGRDESFICQMHSGKLRAVAEAIGYGLQLIPINQNGQLCRQSVSGEKCKSCNGCGAVANDDEATPWTYWAELEPPANLAVQAGIVKPIECPSCKGEGYV